MYSCELAPVVRSYWIPSAHLGTEWTVDHMREIATRAARAPEVADAAAEIVGPASGARAAGRIRDYLESNVRFEFDPPGVELIRTPELLLAQIRCHGEAFGDCDDVAVLGAALGLAVGLRPSYVLLAFHDTDPFEHVYTELATDSGPVELDTTRPAHLPPELEIRRAERREVVMYGPSGGLSGFWSDVGSGLQTTEQPEEGPSWWEAVIESVGTAGGEWVVDQIPSTDPYGPGYVGPTELEAEKVAAVKAGAPAMSPLLNTLVVGGLALAGLRVARII